MHSVGVVTLCVAAAAVGGRGGVKDNVVTTTEHLRYGEKHVLYGPAGSVV